MQMRAFILIFMVVLIMGVIIGIATTSALSALLQGFPANLSTTVLKERANEAGRLSESSKNVIRVYGADVYKTAVAVSQLVYPGPYTDGHPDTQPGVVILVPSETGEAPLYAEALPATALIHHPRNGPILFTEPNRLNPDTASELRRLNPTGGTNWPQVFIVGRISAGTEDEVRRLGIRTERLSGVNPYETAALIDERIGQPENVLIIRDDDPSYGMMASSWIAHMDNSSILFSENGRLPEATLGALQARQKPFAVYILGPESNIPVQVEEQFRALPGASAVARIAGDNPFSTAVAFARFKQGEFGWGIESSGHGFYFTTPECWQDAVAGALTSHLGGHGPLLFITRNGLPQETRLYLESVKPFSPEKDPTQARFNRGYLIAPPEIVAFDHQSEVDWLLEAVPQMEDMSGM